MNRLTSGLALSAGLLSLIPASAPAAGNAPQPNICTRACWAARSASSSQMSALTRAIVHHTAGNEFNTTSLEASKANVRAIQNMHMGYGWGDIGYHFLVDKFGNIFEGRVGSMSGLPRGTHDATNTNSFGFNLMGYFHPNVNNVPTAAMMNALYDVIAWRMPSAWRPYGSPGVYGELGISVGYLDAHRRVKSTACPGDGVFNPYMGSNVNAGVMRDQINLRITGTPPPPPPTLPNEIELSGDFNGDGRQDVAWRKNGWGNWIVNYGHGVTGALPPSGDGKTDFDTRAGTVAVAGDFDGDGRTDLAWRKPGWPNWFVNNGSGAYGNGSSDGRTDFDPRGGAQVQLGGDFNNDGFDDIAWRKTGWGNWIVNFGNAPAGALPAAGDGHTDFDPRSGQGALAGDVDGDGKTDLAYRKPGWPNWYIDFGSGAHSNGASDGRSDFNAGASQTQVSGDLNGDGRADLAWRKSGWGNWIVNYGSGSWGAFPSGGDGRTDFDPSGGAQLSVVGDFDGDLRDDICWRKAGWPNWYINAGSGGYGNALSDGRTDFDPRNRGTVAFAGRFDTDAKADIVFRKAGWPTYIIDFGAGGNNQQYMGDGRNDFDPRLY